MMRRCLGKGVCIDVDGIDIINIGARPCIVTHKFKGEKVEKRAIFHKWVTNVVKEDGLFMVNELALVEYEDGTVAQVKLKNLRFLDDLVLKYFSIVNGGTDESTEHI